MNKNHYTCQQNPYTKKRLLIRLNQQAGLDNIYSEVSQANDFSSFLMDMNSFSRTHKTERYGKSNAQVGLRFLYQQDIVIIPKSTHIERMKENLNILDFELTPEEMKELAGLDLDRSMFGWW